MIRAALLLMLLAAPVWADGPKITIPAEIPASGDYVVVTPDTTAKAISYVAQSGVDAFPSSMLRDPRTFVLPVRGLPAGRYQFTAVGTLNDEQSTATFTVVVGTGPPPAPDAFQQALQTAFGNEGASLKAAQVRMLASFYRTAAATTVNDPNLHTYGELQDTMKLAVKNIGLTPGALSGLVRIIASDELRAFPNPNTTLDSSTRKLAAAEFIRIAAALEGLR
jgi:hypothetical protein